MITVCYSGNQAPCFPAVPYSATNELSFFAVCKDLTVHVQFSSPCHGRATLLVTSIFLCADPRISLDMSSYMIAENGNTLSVCAVLSNVLPMDGTTSDISTTFVLTNGDAGKTFGLYID